MISRDGSTTAVALSGELDMSAGDALAQLLTTEVSRPGTAAVRADLGDVDFIDSTAISVLIEAYLSARNAGRSFVVTRARGHVSKVLTVSGVLGTLSPPAA